MRYSIFLLAFAFFVSLSGVPAAQAASTEVTWFGHAAFQIKTPGGKVLLVDPWVTNPANPHGKDDLAKIDKADLILITHAHSDHVGDAVAIAKKTGARLVSVFDLGNVLATYAGYPPNQMGFDTMGNFGGAVTGAGGEVTIRFVPAIHGSTLQDAKNEIHGAGNPGGFVISIKNGPTFYHTGDTDVFGDMARIGERPKIDYMLACIGGHFTMDPEGAADAVKMVKPKTVIPMHFGTFPVLNGTPAQLEKAIKANGAKAKVRTLKIGEPVKL